MYDDIKSLDSKANNLTEEQLADEAMSIAMKQIMACQEFKKPRIITLNKYWKLYDGKVEKKLRQLFNIPLPVFSGMVDTLNAIYDTPIQLRFQEGDPSDYFKVQKINGAWSQEVLDVNQNSKWDAKLRMGRRHKIINGRDIYRYSVTSDPEYKSELLTTELDNFNFQPSGGMYLENHLWAGEEDIEKTESDLLTGVKNGIYDRKQVTDLISLCAKSDHLPDNNPDFGKKLERFKPLGLDANAHSYVGDTVYKMSQHILEIRGVRWYLVFHPWTMKYIRFQKWREICSSELYPWVSSASHEDTKNFLSKSYADDLYPTADSIIALFNQEMTNREKRNFGARAYDKDMFTDVRKLDESMHRPDALVPADTKGGTRQIANGIYEFKVGELGGTINLIDWTKGAVGTDVGVSDITQGQAQDATKKASVSFLEQKAISKRLGWGAQPFQELMGELGKRYVYGLKDHMPSSMAIKLLGENGMDWDTINRLDLSTTKDVDVLIVSTDKQISESELKKDKRKEALIAIGADPLLSPVVNPKWRAEQILKDVGGYDDTEVAVGMDIQTYGDKKSLAKAAEAIQIILEGGKPVTWYGADQAFMQKLVDFASDKRSSLKGKFDIILNYAMSHQQIAEENMARKQQVQAQQDQKAMAQQQMMSGGQPPDPEMQGLPAGVVGAQNKANAIA